MTSSYQVFHLRETPSNSLLHPQRALHTAFVCRRLRYISPPPSSPGVACSAIAKLVATLRLPWFNIPDARVRVRFRTAPGRITQDCHDGEGHLPYDRTATYTRLPYPTARLRIPTHSATLYRCTPLHSRDCTWFTVSPLPYLLSPSATSSPVLRRPFQRT